MTYPFESDREAPKMLVADDDPSIVRVIAERCLRIGFNVETASNGIGALLKASRGKPDILVIDVNMPEVDGLSVCAHLLDPGKKPLDVIVVTGSRDLEAIERCEGFGAYYVRKGLNFWSELEAALTELYPAMAGRIGETGKRGPVIKLRSRPRVLLIDDDSDINTFLASRLEKCGIELLYASDAPQGFRMACRDEPTVIVTDFFMPNGDAQFLLTRLRTNATTENTPVIVFSGRQLNEVTSQALKREICGHPGAVQILRKSTDTGELFETLKKFCGFEREGISGSEFGMAPEYFHLGV
jgi:CheY-like chemotaxis protein